MIDHLCIGGGIFCLVYFIAIGVYAGFSSSFIWIWLVGAGVLIAAGKTGVLQKSRAADVAAILILVILLSLTGIVLKGMNSRGTDEPGYILVLGAQVKGRVPSRSLRMRIKKAASLAEEYPSARIIVSGGMGPGEEITEAQCMKHELEVLGTDSDRSLMEEKSTSTRENLIFSDELTDCGSTHTMIVTNDFHVARAELIARNVGYKYVSGAAAPSDAFLKLHFILREDACLVLEWIRNRR